MIIFDAKYADEHLTVNVMHTVDVIRRDGRWGVLTRLGRVKQVLNL